MQSHDGDIELSVTLSTDGIESDIKKIKKKIEDASKQNTGKIGMYVADNREQIKKEVQAMIDNVNKSLEEDNNVEITPTIDENKVNQELSDFETLYKKWISAIQNDRSWGKNTAPALKEQLMSQFPKEFAERQAPIDDMVESMHNLSDSIDEVGEDVDSLNNSVDKTFDSDSTDEYIASLDEIKNKITALYDGYDKGTVPSYVVKDQIKYLQEDVTQLSEEEQDAFDQWFSDLQKTRQATEELKKAQEQVVQSSESSVPEANVEKYVATIKDAQAQLKSLANDYLIMKEGFHYSEDFVRLKKDAESLTKELNNTNEKLHKMELEGETDTEQYAKMVEKADNLSMVLHNILIDMNTMRDDGSAFEEGIDPEQLQQVEKLYDTLATKTALMCKKKSDGECPPEKMKQLKDNTLKAIPAVQKLAASLMKMAGGNMRRSFSSISTFLKRMTSQAGRFAKQSTKMFRLRDILGYAIGIRSLFSLFTKLRSYITEGTNNLAKWRDGNNRANESLSTLTSTLQWMKNAWGAAFEPILTYVTPVLDTLISKIAEVANAISYMMAKLTGQSTWMKAIRVQKDYAKSLSGTGSAAKEAEEGLAQYDKLVMVNKQNTGGGASANADIDDMFEEVSMDDAVDWVDDFLAKIKEAWDKADFTDIGNIIGEWLKNALDSIPWKEIQTFAKKLAHSLATLLNGFFETEGLGTTIGKTIAEALKTAFMFVNEFVHTLHWDSIGRFIADALLAIFEDEELFKEAGEAIGGTIRGFIDMIWAALDEFTENDGFTKIGQRIADFVNSVLAELNRVDEDGLSGWEKLGQSISMSVEGLLDTVSTALAKADWHSLANGIVQVLENIEWLEIIGKLNNVASNLLKAIADAIKGITDEGAKGALATAIALVIAGLVITVDSVTLMILAATVLLGFNLGELIGEQLFPEDAVWYKEFDWSDIFGETDFRSIVEGMIELLSDLGSWWDKLGESNLRYIPILGGVLQIISIASGSIAKFYSIVLQLILFVMDNLPKVWEKMQEFSDKYVDFWWGGEKSIYGSLVKFLQKYANFWWGEGGVWSTLTEFLGKYVDFWWGSDGVWDNIKKFENDVDFWFIEMIEGIKGFFTDCLFWIDDFFNNSLEYAENFASDLELVLNNIISMIESLINSAIDGINSLFSTIGSIDLDFSGLPSAIQDKIGTGISFDLPTLSHVSIPRLAQGAVIPPNKQFLAMLGDQKSGVNIETPLDTMIEAFKIAMEDFGANNNQPIVLQLDGRTIAQAVWDEDRKKYRQTRSFNY